MSIVRSMMVLGAGFAMLALSACSAADDGAWGETVGEESAEAKGGKKCGSPNLQYVSRDPGECSLIKFFCAEGEPFFNNCGCGCDVTPVTTPCGTKSCGTGEYCCNESCGICAPEGGFCTMQVCGSSEPL